METRGPVNSDVKKEAVPEKSNKKEASSKSSTTAPAITSTATGTIAITFDDGPIKEATEEVISALGTEHATFFLTGKSLVSDPKEQKRLVELELSKGHQIANHTYSHEPFKKEQNEKYGDLSDPEKKKEFLENFKKNDKYFKKFLADSSTKFSGFELARLPGDGKMMKDKQGHHTFIDSLQNDLGLVHVGWDFEFAPNGVMSTHLKVFDWQKQEGVASEVSGLPKDGDVVLLHDMHWKGKGSILKKLIDFLKTKFKLGKLNKSGKVS